MSPHEVKNYRYAFPHNREYVLEWFCCKCIKGATHSTHGNCTVCFQCGKDGRTALVKQQQSEACDKHAARNKHQHNRDSTNSTSSNRRYDRGGSYNSSSNNSSNYNNSDSSSRSRKRAERDRRRSDEYEKKKSDNRRPAGDSEEDQLRQILRKLSEREAKGDGGGEVPARPPKVERFSMAEEGEESDDDDQGQATEAELQAELEEKEWEVHSLQQGLQKYPKSKDIATRKAAAAERITAIKAELRAHKPANLQLAGKVSRITKVEKARKAEHDKIVEALETLERLEEVKAQQQALLATHRIEYHKCSTELEELQDEVDKINKEMGRTYKPATPEEATPAAMSAWLESMRTMLNARVDDQMASQEVKEKGIGMVEKFNMVSQVFREMSEFHVLATADASTNSAAVARQQASELAAHEAAQMEEAARRRIDKAAESELAKIQGRPPPQPMAVDAAEPSPSGGTVSRAVAQIEATGASGGGSSSSSSSDPPITSWRSARSKPVREWNLVEIVGEPPERVAKHLRVQALPPPATSRGGGSGPGAAVQDVGSMEGAMHERVAWGDMDGSDQ